MPGVPASRVRELGLTLGAFVVGLLLLTLFLGVAGFDVPVALDALWRGAAGSWYAVTSATLVRAIPLFLLGLAFMCGTRGGALNIGMEGQFACGAMAAAWVGGAVGGWPAPVALLAVLGAGGLAGAAWVAVPVLLRVRSGVTEVITTLLLTFVAEALVAYAVTGPLQEPTRIYPQSAPIAAAAELPRIVASGRLHAGLLIVIGIGIALWFLLARTRWGFLWRAAGSGPLAARLVGGIPADRVLAMALLASGALAGLGGAIEVGGVSHALYLNLSPGYGFTAIAVALLGRQHPAGIALAALLFGALEAGAGAMQRDAAVPAVAVQVVEAVVIVVMLVAARRRG